MTTLYYTLAYLQRRERLPKCNIPFTFYLKYIVEYILSFHDQVEIYPERNPFDIISCKNMT